MINDPTPHRVSACPVHFIWDGQGQGRMFVRAGFMGFVVAGMIGTGGSALHVEGMRSVALAVLGVAAASWSIGQVLTRMTARRFARR